MNPTGLNKRFQLASSTFAAVLAMLWMVVFAHAVPIRTSQFVGLSSGVLGSAGAPEVWNGDSDLLVVTNGSGSLDGVSLGLFPSNGDKVELRASVSSTNSMNTFNGFATAGQFPRAREMTSITRFSTASMRTRTSSWWPRRTSSVR